MTTVNVTVGPKAAGMLSRAHAAVQQAEKLLADVTARRDLILEALTVDAGLDAPHALATINVTHGLLVLERRDD